ncbi:hypothetical protein AAGW05_12910 [Arthrobacter sp. LAPM80]|uniref:hypothetical protein n=1 Tax=Arthrobacter sp. LAPM80 TaxID=3141788 RepID=UPI00398B07AB
MTSRRNILAAVAVGAALLGLGTACFAPDAGPSAAPSADSAAREVDSASPAATLLNGGVARPRVGIAATTASGPLREVHSPGAVDVDELLTPGQCIAKVIDAASGEVLPDPSCTPGAVDPAVTEGNLGSTICMSGYTATVRPPASATDRFKVISLLDYGESPNRTIELDHLVSLELGGANSATNLWPELNRTGATGTTNPKDAVEGTLHKAVCDHRVKLIDAQNAVARDWYTAIRDLGL